MALADTDVRSMEWLFAQMKMATNLETCKADLKKNRGKTRLGADYCQRCGVLFHYDYQTSDRVCYKCGIAIHFVMDEQPNRVNIKRYNRAPRHHYTTAEHYSQVVCDFTCTGNRNVPVDVMAYCRTALGRGITVTSERVFQTLKSNGYRGYYHYKYEIANRLRGKPEFDITTQEVRDLRDTYKRYGNQFLPFQRSRNIGRISSRGKLRVFWPMRYILARMCEEIGRGDLTRFIRGIAGKKRLQEYDEQWTALKEWVDHTNPKPLHQYVPDIRPISRMPRTRPLPR